MKQRLIALLTSSVFSLIALLFLFLFVVVSPTAAVDYTVGGVCGATIQACINFAAAGDTVIVPNGVYNENVVLDKAVSLQGESTAGAIIDAAGSGRGLFITGAAVLSDTVVENLTITNGDVSGANVCSDQFDLTNCGGGVLIAGGAYPTLRNLLIDNNAAHDGGGLFVERDGGVLLDTVELANNLATQVGGGAVFHGEVTILNSQFRQNRSQNAGGGASVAATFPNYPPFPVFISGTTFISNTAECTTPMCFLDGGGLDIFEVDAQIINSRFENNRCSNTSERCTGGGLAHSQSFNNINLVLQNTDFISNMAQYAGGGVAYDATFSGTIVVTGGQFNSNTLVGIGISSFTGGEGGGLFVRDGATQMTGTQFIDNIGLWEGGGFYALGDLSVNTVTFQNNQVISGSGGGMASGSVVNRVSVVDTVFVANTAALNGGGLFTPAPAVISGGRFEGNQSLGTDFQGFLDGGGGIFASQPLTLTNVDFMDNTAFQNGGGIYLLNGHPLIINGGRFEGNEAQAQETATFSRGGGGFYVVGSVQAVGTVFIGNTAVMTNSFNDANSGGAGFILGSAVFDQVVVQNNSSYSSGGGFFVDGEVTVMDSTFDGNDALTFSGGGLATDQPATITGGSFTNNSAGSSGGGLSISTGFDAGEMTISGVLFDNNTAVTSGGGLSLNGEVTVTVSAVDFQNNQVTAGSGGGATIATIFDGQAILNGINFLNNTATVDGGGLAFNQGILNGGVVSQNSAAAGGGINANGLLIINGTQIINNTATDDGGGINSNSDVRITNGLIQENQSTAGSGGGVWGNSAVLMTDTQVLSNTAAVNGGGAFADLGFATTMIRVLFNSNSAGNAGGGLFVGRRLELSSDTRFINNNAQLGGGLAISATTGTTGGDMVNNLFSRNVATVNGAAIYLHTPRPLNVIHTTIADVVLNGGEAVYVISSTLVMTNSIVANHAVGIVNVSGAVTSDANVYFGNTANESGAVVSSGIVIGDPMFVNPAADDYRLVLGSAALDNGLPLGVAADILGVARPVNGVPDRGAYEGPHTPTAVAGLVVSAATDATVDIGYSVIIVLLLLATLCYLRLQFKTQQYEH